MSSLAAPLEAIRATVACLTDLDRRDLIGAIGRDLREHNDRLHAEAEAHFRQARALAEREARRSGTPAHRTVRTHPHAGRAPVQLGLLEEAS